MYQMKMLTYILAYVMFVCSLHFILFTVIPNLDREIGRQTERHADRDRESTNGRDADGPVRTATGAKREFL